MISFKSKLKNMDLIIITLGTVILYTFLSMYYFPSDTAYARVHDYLEGLFSVYKIRAVLSGFFLDYNYVVQQIFNGISLNVIGISDFNVGANMYLLFEPFDAYVINQFLFRTFGFFGLLLLLKDHFLPRGYYSLSIAVCTALAFGLLNHFPTRFGTILYQPLLYWAFLNIYKGPRRISDVVIIFAYPFMMGSIVRGGFVGVGIIVLGSAYLWIRNHENKKYFLVTGIGCFALTLLVESRLFYQYFFTEYESARNLIMVDRYTAEPLFRIWEQFVLHFVRDNYGHHIQGQWPFMIWPVAIGILVVIYRWKYPLQNTPFQNVHNNLAKKFLIIIGLAALVSLIYAVAIVYSSFIARVIGLPMTFHRVSAISPILWHLMFSISLSLLVTNYGLFVRKMIVPIILFIVVAYAAQQQFYGVKQNINKSLGLPENLRIFSSLKCLLTGSKADKRTIERVKSAPYVPLKEFFRTDVFESINKFIAVVANCPKSNYRVMSYEMPSSVLQFHGFYTLGALASDQSMEYAKDFTNLFIDERAKDNKNAFAMRGRLYPYISSKSYTPNGITPIFDVRQFLKMGGRFVFSGKPILNASDLHLLLLKSYKNLKPTSIGRTTHDTYDSIYLYQVVLPPN